MTEKQGLVLMILWPIWGPIVIFLGVAFIGAAIAFFVVPIWWMECQVITLSDKGHSTWTCLEQTP